MNEHEPLVEAHSDPSPVTAAIVAGAALAGAVLILAAVIIWRLWS